MATASEQARMRQVMGLCGVGVLLVIGCAAPARAQQGFERRADEIVAAYARTNRFWGTVLVARGGRVAFEKAYGYADLAWRVPATVNARYEIASLTKAFTGVAIAQLAAQGRLGLEDPVSRFYAQAPPAWRAITIRELLNHTSGLPNDEIADFPRGIAVPYTKEELIATFRDRPLRFQPGTSWAYTNTEYYLLAYIIEQLSGEKYGEYLQHHIFQPLGMKDSGFAPTSAVVPRLALGYARAGGAFRQRDYFDRSLEIGAGGVHSTLHDLLLWDRALAGGALLPAGLRKQIFTPSKPGSYGFGWFVTQDRGTRIWHEGSDPGYAAFIIRRPETQLLIVVLSNLEDAPVREIAGKLEDLALPR